MVIATTYENDQIFQHFGHTEKFKVYVIDGSEVIDTVVVDTMGEGHDALAGLLSAIQVDILICGGIGMGAQNALNSYGIGVVAGIDGDCDTAVADFLRGALELTSEATCDHHHEDDCNCGGGCHSSGCGGCCH